MSSNRAPVTEFTKDTVIVVFGASGDLAKKKTFPALFGLFTEDLLPSNTSIIGYARSPIELEDFRKRISSYFKTPTPELEQKAKDFVALCTYVSGNYDKDESFLNLLSHVESIEEKHETKNRLFYLAVPPSVFLPVATQLKKHLHPGDSGVARVIVEKPFGHDLASSEELQKGLAPLWTEEEIFRIDHYLGKEMVKNILPFRFSNQFINAAWNKDNIANIQISFKEPFGTEGRGGYFNDIGIIRDVMQNHLLQVLCLIGMERPVSTNAEDIRDEKVKLLRAVQPLSMDDVILGQYGASEDGTKPAYVDDETVPKDSRAVTFAALHMQIHNERWEGVPFILRAGKALDQAKVEVRIQYKDAAKGMFNSLPRNELVIRIQPSESIYAKMNSKLPGYSTKNIVTDLDLTYHDRYEGIRIPEAYESLILDCIKGVHSNFVRDDELKVSWKIFTPLLHEIENNKDIVPEIYPYGSRAPESLPKFLSERNYRRGDTELYSWPVTKGQL
ncbi:glucose-6-phosphate dehydrogenase [Nadsonia fulvescens var. elongata DSM 6958]|uniref:Glucose-6-phosphate 1-dehydrogenase n=1 Tax=Nadsonia fulvescens var. elongata DSM 6958 TaxID=857566 RepID=A0A1E3PSU7_9ASCO|nr:glucose-6-phosphate dehydrogenase [Nadsonia fulvescens var. elongata DSM 6958]